jgi:micrococcal nuclease
MIITLPDCMVRAGILCLIWLISLVAVPPARAWEGKVNGVTDGCYINVLHEGKGERISLYGVDCPGIRQDFGQKAKAFTSERALRNIVEVEPVAIDRKGTTKDQYGRTLALIYTGGQKCLNQELIGSGFAWVYNQYCTRPECKQWKELEKQAKRQRIGLWSVFNPIPPWEFRHSKGAPVPIYQGDIVKHVFHASNCEEFDCSSCIAIFRGREQALRAGYKSCGKCNP